MEETKGQKTFYYWVILVMGFLMMFCSTMTSGGFAIEVRSARVLYEFGGTESSLIFTIKNVAAFLTVLISTKYFDILGLRKGVPFAFLMATAAFIICSVAGPNLFLYYVGAVFDGFGYALTMVLPMSIICSRWYNKGRATMTAIMATSTGLNGMIMSPLQQQWITNLGLPATFRIMACIFAVFAVLFFILVRDYPADIGLEPYGGNDYVDPKLAAKSDEGETKAFVSSLTNKEKVIWLFVFCAFATGFASPNSQQHWLMYFSTMGYDDMLAASAYATLSGVLLFSKPIFGAMAARMKFNHVSTIFYAFFVVAFGLGWWIGFQAQMPMLPFIVCGLHGVAGAVNTLGYPNFVADFTSKDVYPAKIKNAQLGYQMGEIVGSFIPGVIFDVTGTYAWWYLLAAAVYIACIIIVNRVYGARDKELKAAEASIA